ncbi:MAG: cytochrome c biogenesis protein [Candidatus Cyclobacteriaceae bacterium M3_2C_046]
MGWSNFIVFISGSLLFWLGGMATPLISPGWNKKRTLTILLTGIGIFIMLLFIIQLWTSLGRPPLRTLGETRLWYAFFLPVIGLLLYIRWNLHWALTYSLLMSLLFLVINLLKPETHDQTLMPALQSGWFIPHVLVYIFAYAILAASAIVAVRGLFQHYYKKATINYLEKADILVYLGFAFLSLGLVFGALWAKEAWGHYWTWDPKETWALLTWLFYLVYIHLRYHRPQQKLAHSWVLALAFVVLLICWFGINYLQVGDNSVHTYSN